MNAEEKKQREKALDLLQKAGTDLAKKHTGRLTELHFQYATTPPSKISLPASLFFALDLAHLMLRLALASTEAMAREAGGEHNHKEALHALLADVRINLERTSDQEAISDVASALLGALALLGNSQTRTEEDEAMDRATAPNNGSIH